MCMRYIHHCGGKNHIVFIDDSQIRQLFKAFDHHIDSKSESKDISVHKDLKFRDSDLKLDTEFLWHPMMNHSMDKIYTKWVKMESRKRPTVMTGSATWSIHTINASMDALEDFKSNLKKLVSLMNELNSTIKILWILQDRVVLEKLHLFRSMIKNEQIDFYNKAAIDILKYISVFVWSSSHLVSQGYNQDPEDSLHIGQVALNYAAQILLNMYCNDHMNYNDGTCCSSAEPVTVLQIVTFSNLGVCFFLVLAMMIHKIWKTRRIRQYSLLENCNQGERIKRADDGSWYELFTSLRNLGIIMAYFYLCNRTNFFMKENNYYTQLNFFLPFAYAFALGLFFTKDSQYVLPIYMHVRVLVTSYLFLNDYNHFTYFWRTGDYGLIKFWQGVAFGMLFAFAYHHHKLYRFLDDYNHGNLFSRGITLTATLASFVGIGIYATFAFLSRNKLECNKVHPYISFVSIISYVILRNISVLLCTRYNPFFAWFEIISLEIFITLYHIWLAADTHGVLILVPSYPVLNVMVTSFIFVCIAHEVSISSHQSC